MLPSKNILKILVFGISFLSALPVFANAADIRTATPVTHGTLCNNDWPVAGGSGVEFAAPLVDPDVKPVERFRDIRGVIATEAQRGLTMKDLGGGLGPQPAMAKAQQIRLGNGSIEFKGLGYASFLTFGQAFEDLNSSQSATNVTTRGQLIAFYNSPDANVKSCIAVEMWMEFAKTGANRHFKYRLHIFFEPLQIATRVTSGASYNPSDVFPDFGLMKISESMADLNVTPGSRTHKIHDSGSTIQVTFAEISRSNHPSGNGWHEVQQTTPMGQLLYAASDHACIDMMFIGAPPQTLSAGDSPPKYCLGRCSWPPVVNTGF